MTKNEQSETEQNQDTTITKKQKIRNNISVICAIISALVLLFDFLYDATSYERHTSSDMLAKANMGDCVAQFFLADHYYVTGDLSQSMYWYKILANETDKIGCCAKNNLAIIYIEMFKSKLDKINHEESVSEEILDINKSIVGLFNNAFLGGLETAGLNLYAYFQQNPEVLSSMDNYNEIRQKIYEKLRENGYQDILDSLEIALRDRGNIVYSSAQTSSDTKKYDYVSVSYGLTEDGKKHDIKYVYRVYEMDVERKYEYKLCYPG